MADGRDPSRPPGRLRRAVPAREAARAPGRAGRRAHEETRRLIDAEVRRLLHEAEDAAITILQEHRERLDGLRAALLEHESLDETAAYAAAGLPLRPAPAAPLPPSDPASAATPSVP